MSFERQRFGELVGQMWSALTEMFRECSRKATNMNMGVGRRRKYLDLVFSTSDGQEEACERRQGEFASGQCGSILCDEGRNERASSKGIFPLSSIF